MSRASYAICDVRKGLHMGPTEVVDTMISEGLYEYRHPEHVPSMVFVPTRQQG